MKDAVKNGACESTVIIEHFGPVDEGDVAGEDNAAGLISGADDLKEEIGFQLSDGQITNFIDAEDVRTGIGFERADDVAGRLCGDEAVDHVCGRIEKDGVSFFACVKSQSAHEVGFPHAGDPEESDIASFSGEIKVEDEAYEFLVDFGRMGPVERGEGFFVWEMSLLNASFDGAFAFVCDLSGDGVFKEFAEVDFLFDGIVCEGEKFIPEIGQTEIIEIVSEFGIFHFQFHFSECHRC